MSRPALRITLTVALVITVAIVATSCAGNKDNQTANTTVTSSASSADSPASTATTTSSSVKTSVRTIDKTIWFAGFKLTVKTATLKSDPDSGAGIVDLTVAFNNLGTDPVRFDGQLALRWGGNNDQFDTTTLPTVSAGDTRDATLTFSVDGLFRIDNATLTVGAAGHHRAIVPLGSNGQLVDLAPIRVGLTGSVTAGNLKATVTAGELRADVAKSHLELNQGQEALFLTSDIAWSGPSSYTLGRNNFALLLPNGTQVTADEGPIEMLSPGATKTNETVRFTVSEPASGSYQLIVRDPTANNAQGELPFVLAVNDATG